MASATELLDLDGVSQRAETVRFDVLDASLNAIGEVAPIRDEPPEVTNDTERTVKRTLTGFQVSAADSAALTPLSDRIRPMWVLSDGTEYPLGVFLWADATYLRRTYGLDVDGGLVDQTLILDQGVGETVSFPAGTSVTEALTQLVVAAGLPSVNIEASGVSLGLPATWRAGTTLFQILSDLAAATAFYSPYFDNSGTFQLKYAQYLSSATPQHVYREGTATTGRIIDGSITESDDLLSAPNRYLMVGTGPTDLPVFGSYDVPDDAPYSFVNRGFRIVAFGESQLITTAGDAAEAARAWASQDAATYRWVDFSSTPDPRHDTFDIVEWIDGNLYREQGWSLRLSPGGAHQHSLRRLYYA